MAEISKLLQIHMHGQLPLTYVGLVLFPFSSDMCLAIYTDTFGVMCILETTLFLTYSLFLSDSIFLNLT